MNNYVEELKKVKKFRNFPLNPNLTLKFISWNPQIIETMSYTENVADFMGSVSELDGVSVEDLEAVAPEAIQKVRSQPNSPFGESSR